MTPGNFRIIFDFGVLNVAENPKFTSGVQYTWTDVWKRKKYELVIRETDISEPDRSHVTACDKEAEPVLEQAKPRTRRTGKLLKRYSKRDTAAWRLTLAQLLRKRGISLKQLAQAAGMNYSTLRWYVSKATLRVPVEAVERVKKGLGALNKRAERRAKR